MEIGNGEIAVILGLNACICLLLPRILTLNWSQLVNVSDRQANS